MVFHTVDGEPYWHESAYYKFGASEVDRIEAATNELNQMLLAAAQKVIDEDRWGEFCIPDRLISLIKRAWEEEPPSLYCRLDLAYDGQNIKLLEANADTPTMLFEVAVVQWLWKEDVFPNLDQFCSVHERLVDKWEALKEEGYLPGCTVHFAHGYTDENTEDAITNAYLMDTAREAGVFPVGMSVEQLGYETEIGLVDMECKPIRTLFKLYPWEWLIGEDDEDGRDIVWLTHSVEPRTQWIEPIWKMILSNKMIMPLLWEMYPNHPLLLECYADGPRTMADYVKKPILSREGANVTIVNGGQVVAEQGGDYGSEGYIYQADAKLPCFDGLYPIIGSWLIDGESAGIGVREAANKITNNTSIFTPHVIDG